MDFLPKDYETPQGASNYMRLEEGANKFRVLSSAIVGYEYWIDEGGKRKPIRERDFSDVPNEFKNDMKHFWAFIVWSYQSESVQILEITQKTIMSFITALVQDEAWGDPKEYDISIFRKGEGLETSYSVVPTPPSTLDVDADISGINLEALYEGEDPFAEDIEPSEVKV